MKEGENFDPMKAWMLKGSNGDAYWIIKYVTLEDKVHKYSCKEYDGKSNWSTELQTAVGCVLANWD